MQAKRQQHGRGTADLPICEQTQGISHTLVLGGLLQSSRAVGSAAPSPSSRVSPPPKQATEVAVVPGSEARTNLACATVTTTVRCPQQDGVYGETPFKGTSELKISATTQGSLDELGDVDMSMCVGANELPWHVKEHDAWAVKALEHSELVDGVPAARRLICSRWRRGWREARLSVGGAMLAGLRSTSLALTGLASVSAPSRLLLLILLTLTPLVGSALPVSIVSRTLCLCSLVSTLSVRLTLSSTRCVLCTLPLCLVLGGAGGGGLSLLLLSPSCVCSLPTLIRLPIGCL